MNLAHGVAVFSHALSITEKHIHHILMVSQGNCGRFRIDSTRPCASKTREAESDTLRLGNLCTRDECNRCERRVIAEPAFVSCWWENLK